MCSVSDVGPRDSRDPGTCSRTSSIDSSNLVRQTRRFRMYDASCRIARNNVHIKSCTRAQRDDSLRFNLWNLLPREWEMANDLAQRFGRRRPIPAESRAREERASSALGRFLASYLTGPADCEIGPNLQRQFCPIFHGPEPLCGGRCPLVIFAYDGRFVREKEASRRESPGQG